MKKVVLAYSGGLDTSVAVAWLKEQYGVEVVTLTVDLGGESLRESVAERALAAGASRAYVADEAGGTYRLLAGPSVRPCRGGSNLQRIACPKRDLWGHILHRYCPALIAWPLLPSHELTAATH